MGEEFKIVKSQEESENKAIVILMNHRTHNPVEYVKLLSIVRTIKLQKQNIRGFSVVRETNK